MSLSPSLVPSLKSSSHVNKSGFTRCVSLVIHGDPRTISYSFLSSKCCKGHRGIVLSFFRHRHLFSLHEEGIFGGNNSFLSFHNLHLMMKMGFSSIPERERQKVGRNDCFSSCYFILALLKTVSYLCYEERKGCNISPLLDIIIIFVFCGEMDYYQRKNVLMV